jgi:hypothetical protein
MTRVLYRSRLQYSRTARQVTLQQLLYRRAAVQSGGCLAVAVLQLHQLGHEVPGEACCVAGNAAEAP